ncbi:MAG: hypothetical protein AB7F79_09715 [Steroidobacteraceae bacterium]
MQNHLNTLDQRLYWTAFLLGLGIGLVMVFNAQVGGDQIIMLDLGWSLFNDGQWLQYGMPTSAGGRSPGGLTALLVAAPLYVWQDYRAVAALTLLINAASFLLLRHLLRPVLTTAGQWLLLLLVWLTPWHLYFAAHIWNSNYMFAFAVLHLASVQRMSKHREAWNTALHGLLIALAMQVHTSAAVLAILSILLFLKGHLKIHWGGFVIGISLGIASYLPWFIAVTADPTLQPGNKGFFLRGLVYVQPLFKGLLQWLKMGSLSMADRMLDFDFTAALGATANAWLRPLGRGVGLLAHVSLLVPLWVNWRVFVRRRRFTQLWRAMPPLEQVSPRSGLRSYITLMFAAALISFAVSPTTPMWWQAFVMLPCSALLVIMTTEALLRTQHRQRVLCIICIWSVTTLTLLLMMAIASPMYRCGGRSILGDNTQLFQQLKLPMQCLNPDVSR